MEAGKINIDFGNQIKQNTGNLVLGHTISALKVFLDGGNVDSAVNFALLAISHAKDEGNETSVKAIEEYMASRDFPLPRD